MGLKKIIVKAGSSLSTSKKGIIIKNLFVDISKNVKYVTLSSGIMLENKSNKYIKLRLI
jgi:hypothetical protein